VVHGLVPCGRDDYGIRVIILLPQRRVFHSESAARPEAGDIPLLRERG
jgi:hypothetical protein